MEKQIVVCIRKNGAVSIPELELPPNVWLGVTLEANENAGNSCNFMHENIDFEPDGSYDPHV